MPSLHLSHSHTHLLHWPPLLCWTHWMLPPSPAAPAAPPHLREELTACQLPIHCRMPRRRTGGFRLPPSCSGGPGAAAQQGRRCLRASPAGCLWCGWWFYSTPACHLDHLPVGDEPPFFPRAHTPRPRTTRWRHHTPFPRPRGASASRLHTQLPHTTLTHPFTHCPPRFCAIPQFTWLASHLHHHADYPPPPHTTTPASMYCPYPTLVGCGP